MYKVKKMFKQTTLASMISATLALPVAMAQQEKQMDLSEATVMELFLYAKENNPGLKRQEKLLLAEKKRLPQAYADLLPQISLQGSRGSVDEDNRVGQLTQELEEGQEIDLSTVEFENNADKYDQEQVTLNGSLALIDAGVWTNISTVSSQTKEAVLDFAQTQQEFLAEFLNAYLNLSFALQSLEITEKELRSTRQLANLSTARYQQELGNRIDLLDARSRAGQLEADRIEALNQVETARNELIEIIGQDLQVEKVLAEFDEEIYPVLQEREFWERLAIDNNISLKNLRQGVITARRDLYNARAGHLPSLRLDASVTENETDISRVSQDTDNRTEEVSLVLDFPIFSGGRVLAQGQENRYRLQAAQLGVDELLRELQRDITTNFNSAKTDLERMTALERAFRDARNSQYLHRQAQREGLESQIDTLTAEQQLYSVERSLLRARYDYILSIIELERLSGQLDDDVVSQIESLLIADE